MTAFETQNALLSERRDGILLLTMNRPGARNAINPEMASRLANAFAEFAQNPTSQTSHHPPSLTLLNARRVAAVQESVHGT